MLSLRKVLMGMTTLTFAFILIALITEDAYAITRGVVVGDRVNVRSYGVLDDSNRLFQVGRGQAVDIYDVSGDFFRVSVQDQNSVYISREWVRVSETQGTVVGTSAWVYNMPEDKGGHRLTTINVGEAVTVTSAIDGWYGIDLWGETAFVHGTNIDIPSFVDLPIARVPGSSRLADEIINFAKGYIGTRHVLGGNGPNGFDCSGFVTHILQPFGINVNRHSGDMARNGVHVDRNELDRGDLVFFATGGGNRISHVGLYMGAGEFIHSSSWRSGVRVDSMHDSYYTRRFVTARRVL